MKKNTTPPNKNLWGFNPSALLVLILVSFLAFSCDLCKELQAVEFEIQEGRLDEAQKKYGEISTKRQFEKPSFKEYRLLRELLKARIGKLNFEEYHDLKIDSLECQRLIAFLEEAVANWDQFDEEKIDCISEVTPESLEEVLEILKNPNPPVEVSEEVQLGVLDTICEEKPVPVEVIESYLVLPNRAGQPDTICAEYDYRMGNPFSPNDSIIISYGNSDEACLGIAYFKKGEYSSQRSRRFLAFLKERFEEYFERNGAVDLSEGIDIIVTGTADSIPIGENLIFEGYPENDCNDVRIDYYDEDSGSRPRRMYLRDKERIHDNESLAALRAYEVQCILSQIGAFRYVDTEFKIRTKVHRREEGAEFRRVVIEINIKNARSLEVEKYFDAFPMPARTDQLIVQGDGQEEKQDKANDEKDAKNFAIVIGLQGEGALYAGKDGEDFADFLYKEESKGNKWLVYKLINEEATREQIQALVDRVRLIMGPKDRLYFFYSGLSASGADGQTYFLPYNADWRTPEATGIQSEKLFRSMLVGLEAQHVIFFIDGHPGAVPVQVDKRPHCSIKFLENMSSRFTGDVALLNAASAHSSSYEWSENGLFTQYLIKGMDRYEYADGYNPEHLKDQRVDLTELAHYLRFHIGRRSKAIGKDLQMTELQFYSGRKL